MDFDGWIGCELGEGERERFVRVHEALVAAGPPPQLPLALRRPPRVARSVPFAWSMPPRRRAPQLAAAVAAVVCFGAAGAGYLLSTGSGRGGDGWLRMRATAVAPLASGQLWVGGRDPAGNRPLMLRVRGLPPGRYEMLLTERGRFVGGCGWFRAGAATTTVMLTAPYRLDEGSDWVITRGRLDAPLLGSA